MKRLILIFAASMLSLGGCIVAPDGHGGLIVVAPGHICSDHCDHYYHDGCWYHGHVHHYGCGHVLRGGVWIRL